MNKKIKSWMYRRKYILSFFLLLFIAYLLLLRGPLFDDPVSTVIYDSRGELLGARAATDGQWRFSPSPAVPDKIRKCTLAFEDRFFYWHPGFNPVSLVRAVFLNIRKKKVVSGASTITMQTIRIYRKGQPRTFTEKCIEILLATRLELKYSKNDILNLYVSHAPYGGNVVGIEAAAWRYYGTDSRHLSWAEAATLAVLPNSPALINPGKNRKLLLQKRNRLLLRLYQLNRIDRTTLDLSLAEPLPDKPFPMPSRAPHLLDRFYTPQGGTYITTIDGRMQDRTTEIVEKHHALLKFNEIHNAAAIIIEVETGNVLAYVGNTQREGSTAEGNEVDVIRSPRSTGSILKPLLYAAMLDDGRILPGALLPDVPINLSGFAPVNFSGTYEGAVPANQAISRSLNIPAVEMLREYSAERFKQLLVKSGMTTLNKPSDHYGLSLILGGAEGTLGDIANMYACYSRVLGHYSGSQLYYPGDFRAYRLVPGDNSTPEKGRNEADRISAAGLWFAFLAMNEVTRPEEEAGWKMFSSSSKIAWKTGTSFGFRDGWAIGCSPEYVVGVWTGNADGEGRPGLTGVACAAPLMFELFGLLPSSGWFTEPSDELSEAVVCRESGFLAGPDCANRDTAKIPSAGIHSPLCPFHRIVHLSADRRFRVNMDCAGPTGVVNTSWFVLPPVQEWYYSRNHPSYRSLPPFKPGCLPDAISMDLVYPRENTSIYVPVALDGKKERVVFEAVHRNPEAEIFWSLDGSFIASTRHIHQVELMPSEGKHTLVMVDRDGEELVRHFTILSRDVHTH
jgi:penicillin-binding protein 1C